MWPNPQFSADLVIFTEEILNAKLNFLCSDMSSGKLIFDYFYWVCLHKESRFKKSVWVTISCLIIIAWKVSNREFFLVRIFPHSDWIWRGTPYLSVFSPNAGKYGPEKTPYLDTFHVIIVFRNTFHNFTS